MGQKKINADFRVVCFWDENDKIWHNYVTNLPGDAYKKDEIYQLYRYRWIIELLFKEMKSDYDLGKFLLAREPLALIHVYSMLIRLVLSRNLYKKMVASLDEDEKPRYGPLLWSKVFAEKAHEFLSIIDQSIFGKESVGERWKKLEDSLRRLACSRHKGYDRISLKYVGF
nr:transposase [Methanoplanus limicola]